ncbi:MAG: CRISPR-associated protein Cas4 [Candidatus Reconcilbacillus cellulovorans]|uniref:CRISPR-associated exonuclease Cas4 n=1 Tax=Candidatus Reconcilbacillus cellulovorans TaxID=1906605 RepID=A0A2A6DYS8_9BACL|nr:MAG: CRISPR-associated protein Cas4 [Candidatus Reconcilbacillus cellulovorans]
MDEPVPAVTGTDIWYYFICRRQCWLMLHRIEPDHEDDNIEIGRFLHEYRHGRGQKDVDIDPVRMDRLKRVGDELVVEEIKKSAKFRESARHQLLYYLWILKQLGVRARGELVFSEEKRREPVELTPEAEQTLARAIDDIRRIAAMPAPPPPVKIPFCRPCAYREYCWAEEEG